MVCSNCHSENIEMVNKKTDGQGYYEKEEYVCYDCGEEWEWEMTKTITKEGKQEDEFEGTEGQDRKSYTDTQDRDSYVEDLKGGESEDV